MLKCLSFKDLWFEAVCYAYIYRFVTYHICDIDYISIPFYTQLPQLHPLQLSVIEVENGYGLEILYITLSPITLETKTRLMKYLPRRRLYSVGAMISEFTFAEEDLSFLIRATMITNNAMTCLDTLTQYQQTGPQ